MLPRWLAVLGFAGLCTSFACFPPMAVVPISDVSRPTGATPRPSDLFPGSPSPMGASPAAATPAGGPTPSPGDAGGPAAGAARPAAGVDVASYFPARAGTWRYRVTTTPAGGQAITGERTLTLAEVVTSGDATTATATSNVKLGVPGFTALDEADVRSSVGLTPDRFALTTAGRTTAIPLTASAGDVWTENGLTVRLATWTDRVVAAGLAGKAFENVLRVEYADPAAPTKPVATAWFAPGVGLLQRLDAFTHDGKAWEARAELIDYPGK